MIAIIGAGSLAREVFSYMSREEQKHSVFFVDDKYYDESKKYIKRLSDFIPSQYKALIAISNPKVRKKIVKKLPKNTKYYSFIHESVKSYGAKIGHGCIISPNVVLTTNIVIGNHCQLNINSIISHDVVIGDYFTSAPNVVVCGNCDIGNNVYIGCNSSIKENIEICDNVIIGLNSGVVKNITQPGTYVGTPAKCLR